MKYRALLGVFFIVHGLSAQVIDLNKTAREILSEGLFLYRLERGAWISTDLLSESQKKLVNGYFTYQKNDTIRSIYFDKEGKSAVAGFNFRIVDSLTVELINSFEGKMLNDYEVTLMNIRNHAIGISRVFNSTFGVPEGINPNIIITERANDFYVYSIPGSLLKDVIPLGGDYWFTYTKAGKSIDFGLIHRNLIPFDRRGPEDVTGTVHQHLDRKNKFITATDLCTLLLNRESIEWDIHEVVTKKFISTFDLRTLTLKILPNTTRRKI